jgi:LDH2 family malate/lactate/ureidoglycolate dehydrogenase
MSERIRLSVPEATGLSLKALKGLGYDDAESAILAAHMLDAAYCGYEYSGLPKILQIAANPKWKRPRTPMQPIRETEVSVLFDGGNNNGMLTMDRATDVAIDKARARGFALVGVTNSWMSGRSAFYMERIARADLVGLHTVGAASQVAPPGGRRPALGTNPIAFGFPTQGEPLVIDVGTSAFPGSETDFHILLGREIPEGVAMDEEGKPTRDAVKAKKGALHPFGGHKGFALSLAMQAMGVLAGSGLNAAKDYGYLVLAMRPDLLLPLEDFKRDMTEKLAQVKATPRLPGVEEIRLPSEKSFANRARALREGIEIDRKIHEALLAL